MISNGLLCRFFFVCGKGNISHFPCFPCRSELPSLSLDSSRAATMKPNEPKTSAAAACPASARNTRKRESKTTVGGEGGGGGRERTR